MEDQENQSLICQVCIGNLNIAYDMRKKCLEANKTFCQVNHNDLVETDVNDEPETEFEESKMEILDDAPVTIDQSRVGSEKLAHIYDCEDDQMNQQTKMKIM